jgi:hypothetical protein
MDLSVEDIYQLYKVFLKNNPESNSYDIDWYKKFQKELGIPIDKLTSYGYFNPKFVDDQKLMLFKIKYGT